MITMNEFFQSIISKIKTLLNNYQESAAKAGEKTQAIKPISATKPETTVTPKPVQETTSENPVKANTTPPVTPQAKAPESPPKVAIEPVVESKPIVQTQKISTTNIPEDSVLRRHHLTNLNSDSPQIGKTPIKNKAPDSKKDASTKTNDRIDANIPTDSVLYRHYETMINAELNSLLDHN